MEYSDELRHCIKKLLNLKKTELHDILDISDFDDEVVSTKDKTENNINDEGGDEKKVAKNVNSHKDARII